VTGFRFYPLRRPAKSPQLLLIENTEVKTMPFRSTRIAKPAHIGATPLDVVVLNHDQRHLRRKLLHMANDDVVMLDLKQPVVLEHGDLLVLEDDAGYIEIVAADEPLLEIRARDRIHQIELAWHLGNRHLAAQIEDDRILIERDHVMKAMLEGLGATVTEVTEPFSPVHGAYHSHADHGDHGHHHGH
jgi:urease accessory protein